MKCLTHILLFILLSLSSFAQISVKGRVINQTDTKPVANASVFLSNATIGDKTADNGTFTLGHIKPGKYDLVVSIIGFDTFKQNITISDADITLPDITISPKTTDLNEVTVKAERSDPERQGYYEKFKKEFLGRTTLTADCRILNPELLDFHFKADSNTLTASSVDFLEIQNDALGYKIKYLLNDFMLNLSDDGLKTLSYTGSDLFEELKGTPSQERMWHRQRAEAYEGAVMHFFRAAIADRLEEQGFRVAHLQLNSKKPADSIINVHIKLYQNLKADPQYKDSLAHWLKVQKMPRYTNSLDPIPLSRKDLIGGPDNNGVYALTSNYGMLYICYNKYHRFNKSIIMLGGASANGNTLIAFNKGDVLFDHNGVIADPRSLTYDGAWGRTGVANLLPVDYEDGEQKSSNTAGTQINTISNKLKTFADSQKVEKAYLQFDKPFYAAGDTIYFKAYVVQGALHQPTQLSGVLNVDLVNTGNKIGHSLKLKLTDGVAWGDLALPDTIKAGSYRVRACTNWMRNEGEDAFFEQTIPVGSIEAKKVSESGDYNKLSPATKTVSKKADVQFLPEGGVLVTGNYSKIAFKATGPDGLGTDIKGTVTDDTGNEVCTFASTHLGMGVFNLVPGAGKTYKANIIYNDGASGSIELPKAIAAGYTINLNNSADSIRLRITAGGSMSIDKLSLVAQSGGVVYYAAESEPGSKFFSAVISKKRFPTGIAQFTLFSASGDPLNERLVFINNSDQLKLDVAADKAVSATRQKVNINVNAKNTEGNPVAGSFSVAITDESKVPADGDNENNILTSLLLTSDLKGTVEQPGYYFTNINEKTQADLDLLMLTQGYRRFEWKKVLNSSSPAMIYQPENTLQISGTVKKNNKPVTGGKVTIFTTAGTGLLKDTVTDANGKFVFSNLTFTDNIKFVVQSKVAKGQDDVTLELDTVMPPAVIFNNKASNGLKSKENAGMATYMISQRQFYREQQKYGINKTSIMLEEVKIKDKKEPLVPHSDNLNGSGNADQALSAKDLERFTCGRIADCLSGVLTGVVFRGGLPLNARKEMARMAIVVDGSFVDADIFNNLHPDEIEGIEVVLGEHYGAIYGSRMANGGIIITTKKAKPNNDYYRYAPGITTFVAEGYYKAREFYSPQYDNQHTNQKMADLRSTIYWNPNIITDKDGKASFEYFNADGKGTYRVVIEGIDADGNLGRQVYRYKVE